MSQTWPWHWFPCICLWIIHKDAVCIFSQVYYVGKYGRQNSLSSENGKVSWPTKPPCRFSYSAAKKEKSTRADLRLLKCHFLSLRYDGVCCCVSGTVGWWRWRYRWTEATTVLSHTTYLPGEKIWHRWGMRQGKDTATRQEKQMEKPIQSTNQNTHTNTKASYYSLLWGTGTNCCI